MPVGQTRTHAPQSTQSRVAPRVVGDDERRAVEEHALQLRVRAGGGAEARAQEGEVEEEDDGERRPGARRAPGRAPRPRGGRGTRRGGTKYQRTVGRDDRRDERDERRTRAAGASGAGRRAASGGSTQRLVRSPSTVCGQVHPHQTRPKSSVTSRKPKVSEERRGEDDEHLVDREGRAEGVEPPAGTSNRSALSPPTRTKGSPSATRGLGRPRDPPPAEAPGASRAYSSSSSSILYFGGLDAVPAAVAEK